MESFLEEGQNYGFDSSFINIYIKSLLICCVLILEAYSVFHARGVPPPLGDGRVLPLVSIYLGVGHVGLLSQKKKKYLKPILKVGRKLL